MTFQVPGSRFQVCGWPGLFIECRHEATEEPPGQGVSTETPAGVLMQYVEEVEGAQRSQDG